MRQSQTTTAVTQNPPATPPLPAGRHIVCFWKQADLGLFGRRPDRWITYWAQHPEVDSVLVFEAPVSPAQHQQWQQLASQPDAVSASEFQLLIRQHQTKSHGLADNAKIRYPQYRTPPGQSTIGPDYLRWVLQTIQSAGMESPTLVLWPACFVNTALIQAMRPGQIVVDLVDDQRLFPGNEAQSASITDQYRTLIGLANRVMSNSQGLITHFEAEFGRSISHMPNSLWPMMAEPAAASTALLRQLPDTSARPVIGYTGNLRGRLDTDTLLHIIGLHPEWDFWFVGQTQGSAFYLASRHLLNCRFWGTLCQADAQAIMAHFDVAMIPFKEDPLVKTMSPIKVDAYRRARVPIVTLAGQTPEAFHQALKASVESRGTE